VLIFLADFVKNFANFVANYIYANQSQSTWQSTSDEIQKPYFQDLVESVDEEYKIIRVILLKN
jgi:hypothetical protein